MALGMCAALGLGAWWYSIAPEGILLYTPSPEVKKNYTPSSVAGFFLIALVLCIMSAIATILMFFIQTMKWKPHGYAAQGLYLTLAFGALCVIALLTEKLWP